MKFCRELYSKVALMKAAYNFTDVAYIHLDADDEYYYVVLEPKEDETEVQEQDFVNEMLAQSVRHEVYLQTKSIRELLLARSMATSVVLNDDTTLDESHGDVETTLCENDILRDWFDKDD